MSLTHAQPNPELQALKRVLVTDQSAFRRMGIANL